MIRDTESKITDEELFLSSAFQKYQTSLAKAATGRSRYGLQVLMEWDSSENADIAYTDNYRIHCNAANSITQSFVVDMERIEDTPIIYNTITQMVYENGQWSKQDLDLNGKLLLYVKSSSPMPATTEQINNGF